MRVISKLLRPITRPRLYFHLFLVICLIRFWVGIAYFFGAALWLLSIAILINLLNIVGFEPKPSEFFDNANQFFYTLYGYAMILFLGVLLASLFFKKFPRLYYAKPWIKISAGMIALSQLLSVLFTGEFTIRAGQSLPGSSAAYLVTEESTLLIPAIGSDFVAKQLSTFLGTLTSEPLLVSYEVVGNTLKASECSRGSSKHKQAAVFRKVSGRAPAAERVLLPIDVGAQLVLISNAEGVRLVRRAVTAYSGLECVKPKAIKKPTPG